jgi:RNA polymerase sigma factor (sigma-70 family)
MLFWKACLACLSFSLIYSEPPISGGRIVSSSASGDTADSGRIPGPETDPDHDTLCLLESLPEPDEFVERVLEHISEEIPDTELLSVYLAEIARIPWLSADEENSLLHDLAADETKARRARKKLNESYMRLVVWVAKEYTRGSVQLMDLINEGAIGLLEAVNSYDRQKTAHFGAHVTDSIRKAISGALSEETRMNRVPAYLVDKVSSLKGVTRNLADTIGREPSRKEIAEAVGFEEEELERLIKLVGNPPDEKESSEIAADNGSTPDSEYSMADFEIDAEN